MIKPALDPGNEKSGRTSSPTGFYDEIEDQIAAILLADDQFLGSDVIACSDLHQIYTCR